MRGCDDFIHVLDRREQHPVGIREDSILPCYGEITELSGIQRLWRRRIESLGSGGKAPVTKDREPDLVKFHGIALTSPGDDACQPPGLRFRHFQIADAAFVQPALVIDHEDISPLGTAHRFEEDIHTAVMPHRH